MIILVVVEEIVLIDYRVDVEHTSFECVSCMCMSWDKSVKLFMKR